MSPNYELKLITDQSLVAALERWFSGIDDVPDGQLPRVPIPMEALGYCRPHDMPSIVDLPPSVAASRRPQSVAMVRSTSLPLSHYGNGAIKRGPVMQPQGRGMWMPDAANRLEYLDSLYCLYKRGLTDPLARAEFECRVVRLFVPSVHFV